MNADHQPGSSALKMPNHSSSKRLLVIVAAIALLVAAVGIFSRLRAHSRLADLTAVEAITTVAVMSPTPGGAEGELILPGDMQALKDAPIYARTSGYVKTRLVDIGDQVKAGQVLAELDTPEVDQQMQQAAADLATAQANASLAQATAKRWSDLRATDAVSPQEADEKIGDAAAKAALLNAAKANLQRLRELQGFKRITAPFAGVVTARNTDVGALISAGGSGLELFRVADVQTLRIYINVPQANARDIKVGTEATLQLIERPDQTFPAKIVRTARALDSTSRSLRVELNLDNRTVKLLPGAFVRVHLPVPTGATQLRLPVNTLIFRKEGPQVAAVDANSQVQLKTVAIVQDFGNEFAIGSGITPQDRIIINPPDSLVQGQTVRIAAPPLKADAAK
ncbi:MAG: efflux RND transporter periplasmic adaptor subunit [Spongiibacteraceae bacterium]